MITFEIQLLVSDFWLRPELCSVRHSNVLSYMHLNLSQTNKQIYDINNFNYLGTVFNYTGTFVLNQETFVVKGLKALNCLLFNIIKVLS